jgi:hypothetical protein
VIMASFALTAAFHGVGRLVGRLAGRSLDSLLAIQLGLATLLAVGGLTMLVHATSPGLVKAQVVVGLLLHTGLLVQRRSSWVPKIVDALRSPGRRFWLIPSGLLAVLGGLQLLGAAGDLGARPFDDEGHQLAQIVRLLQTGTLSDPIGFTRSSQLGGQVVLGSLGSLAGDVQLARWLDNGLCFTLALALVISRLRPRNETSCLWAILLVISISALTFTAVDTSACWSAIGLIVALYVSLDDHHQVESTVPIALLAGALATLRSELVPIAVCGLFGAWWIRHRPWREDLSRIAQLGLVAAVVVLPYLITRWLAWGTAPGAIQALLPRTALVTHLLLFVAVFAVAVPLLLLAVDRPLRWPAYATAAGLAGIVSQLAGDRPYATQLVWPIVLGLVMVLVVDLSRREKLHTVGLIVSLLACVLIYEGRDTAGRLRWSRRISNLAFNVQYLTDATRADPSYAELLAQVPPDATVAVWVGRPELLDYTRHRIVDLRVPRVAKLRIHRWVAHASRLDRLVGQVGAHYLLIDDDHELLARRQQDLVTRAFCATPRPGCADDLESVALAHAVIGTAGSARLIDLRR